MLLTALLGWLEREQGDMIAFLREENRTLKAQLTGRRLQLDDAQRWRLAVLGQRLDAAYCETRRRLSRPTPCCDGIANRSRGN
jgi:hypothetical protein